ncbi:MAG: gliding motility-associated C-terminal domain-containing protein [Williamsia sp.]|nr:gliding motility-associated C-terminal domain-containing protein [Williamsia sp.]
MRFVILFFILLVANVALADTFTVTSKADGGAGSLREAIQQAADNGTAVTDHIVFALPGSSKDDRTIMVLSALPDLSSNLVIDGSTQPGANLSVNGAKVVLDFEVQDVNQPFLHTQQNNNIEIYGLYCYSGYHYTACLIFDGVTHLIFGAPGKGNVVSGFKGGLYNLNQTLLNRDIKIQNNFFGVDGTGTVADATLPDGAINLMTAYDLTIGGEGAGEGNVICAAYVSISTNYTVDRLSGFMDIRGNKIGTDITGTQKLSASNSTGSLQLQGYHDGIASLGGNTNVRVSLINNIIASSVRLLKFRDTFFIRGNHFGLGADNATNISQYDLGAAINIYYCNAGVIGGPNETDKNYIANATAGISELYTGNTTISRNSFRCNTVQGIYFNNWVLNQTQPYLNVTSVSSTNISGNAPSKAKIELFYSDDCGTLCEGKTYLTTLTATDKGDWNYTGVNCTNLVGTATDAYGATSQFSHAVISDPDVKITNSTCGKANGSITGLHIISGTSWHWRDGNGNIVSNNLDLTNAPAGTYQLEASIGNNFCTSLSKYFTIENIDLPPDPAVTISNIGCGQPTGSLAVAQSDSYKASWLSVNHSEIGTGFSIGGLTAGSYFLQLTSAGEADCTKTYGPYEIKTETVNDLLVADISIGNATCGKNDGSLTGLQYTAPITPAIYLQWEDQNGIAWGNASLNLSSVPAGQYRLKLKDPANCDTLITPFYTVDATGSMVTDVSGVQVSGSSLCGHPYGSITGIAVTNGETFTWTNDQDIIVGHTPDIRNLPAGNYRLKAENHYGCDATTSLITVPVVANTDFIGIVSNSEAGTCGASDGFIHLANINNQNAYNYRWVALSQPQTTISYLLNLDNILSGSFALYATDRNGCEENVGQYEVTAVPAPVLHEEMMHVANEICSNHKGSITGLTVSGGTAPYMQTWKDGNGTVISTNGSADGLSAGNYQLYLQDAAGCTAVSKPVAIANESLPYAAPLYKDILIPRYSRATLSVSNFQKGIYTLYDDAPPRASLQQNETGVFITDTMRDDHVFYVGVATGSCQSDITKVSVTVVDVTKVAVPAAFTPNGDGINDVFRPKVYGLLVLDDFSVYDRFGKLVFRTKETAKGWKGDKNGMTLNTGTYIWTIRGKDINNKPLSLQGTVVLMH